MKTTKKMRRKDSRRLEFDVLTIFPAAFASYLEESLVKRARKSGLLDVRVHDLRAFTDDPHRKVDDRPFGGGPGMVLKIQPIYDGVESLKSKIKNKNEKIRTILFSTRGKKLDAKTAKRLSAYDRLILICGRYEGVDERVAKYIADEEISIGDYVLSGGELPALVLIEATARFIPGFLGKYESLEEVKGSYPVYTRPEVFYMKGMRKSPSPRKSPAGSRGWARKKTPRALIVPKVLTSGDHAKIDAWRGRR